MPVCLYAADGLTVAAGFEYTTGDYGLSRDTDITTLPLDIQYIERAWRFSLNVPFIRLSGDGRITPGVHDVVTASGGQGQPVTSGNGGSVTTLLTQDPDMLAVTTEAGLGDVVTGIYYALLPEADSRMFYELGAEIKWGTASAEQNLGTGENDYSLSLYTLYDAGDINPYITIGYTVTGDRADIEYEDVLFVWPGLMLELDADTSLSLTYEYQQAWSNNADAGRRLSLYLGQKLDQAWRFGLSLTVGMSNSVEDYGLGLYLSRNIDFL